MTSIFYTYLHILRSYQNLNETYGPRFQPQLVLVKGGKL